MTTFARLTQGAALALMIGTGLAQAQILDWDMDDDGSLTRQEFVAGFTARADFDNWDRDGDGMVAAGEFNDGVFDRYDADRTGGLEGEEYDMFVTDDRWGYDEDWSNTVGGWDVDGDGILLRNEYSVGLGDQYVGNWDADGDGSISRVEFAEGVFNSYDEDSDGLIPEPELTDIGDDMGDGGFWDV